MHTDLRAQRMPHWIHLLPPAHETPGGIPRGTLRVTLVFGVCLVTYRTNPIYESN